MYMFLWLCVQHRYRTTVVGSRRPAKDRVYLVISLIHYLDPNLIHLLSPYERNLVWPPVSDIATSPAVLVPAVLTL